MEFPLPVEFQVPGLFGDIKQSITLYSGLTTFVGPNGSGKSQVLRKLRGVQD